jgi:hypothetical protein
MFDIGRALPRAPNDILSQIDRYEESLRRDFPEFY